MTNSPLSLRHFSLRTQVGWAVGVVLSLTFLIQALMVFSVSSDELKKSRSDEMGVLVNRVAAELGRFENYLNCLFEEPLLYCI